MTTPLILACAWLGDHAVDLWQEPDATWQAGNDDRSVIGHGPGPDEALDAYFAGLQAAREVLGLEADEELPVFVDDFPPDGAAFRVGNMGAFREACLRAAEGEELDLSGCHITPIDSGLLS